MTSNSTCTANQINRSIMHVIVSTALPQMVQSFCDEVNLNPQKRYASYFIRETCKEHFGGFFGNERKIPVKYRFLPLIKYSENPSKDYFEGNKRLLLPPDKVILINEPVEQYIKRRHPFVPYYKACHYSYVSKYDVDSLPRNLPELVFVVFKLVLKRGTGVVEDCIAVTTQFNSDGTVRYCFNEDDLAKLTDLLLEKEPRSFEMTLCYVVDDTIAAKQETA